LVSAAFRATTRSRAALNYKRTISIAEDIPIVPQSTIAHRATLSPPWESQESHVLRQLVLCPSGLARLGLRRPQLDEQVNLKFVHDDQMDKLTAYLDRQTNAEPNENATSFGNQQAAAAASSTPDTRPFLYLNIEACSSTLTGGPGTPLVV
jgi:hypothetical protein